MKTPEPRLPLKLRLLFWFAHRLPPCREISRLASASFERRLTLKERIQIRMHYWICGWCRRYNYQLRRLRELVRTSPVPAAQSVFHSLSSQAKGRLKQALRQSKS